MEKEYIIPKDTSEFTYGTEYQVLKPNGRWGGTLTIRKICLSVRMDLKFLIEQKRIRIVK